MRKPIVLLALCLAACDGQRAPERGVDTSPIGEETPTMGRITGNLSYPSEEIPADIDVCAETLDGKTQHCGAQQSGTGYTLEVPAGVYQVYAYLRSDPQNRAYYSQFVRCGAKLNCTSHAPITVTVDKDQTVSDVEPGDWYPGLSGTQESNAVDQEVDDRYYEPEPEPEPEGRIGASPSYESKVEAARARPTASLVSLFSTDDYPQSAIRNEEQGTTGVRITVGPDGRAWSCDVISSSGSSSLDAATCNILRRRARFVPARDEAGNPISDTYDQRISWGLPQD